MQDILLLSHPTFGVLGIISSVWVFVELLNATESNRHRIWIASLVTATCFALAWILGGWYYVAYYHIDKTIILNGPVPWAHSIFMEMKEHLFFIPLILAFYLPLVARLNLAANKNARSMALVVAAFIALNGITIEGAGAIINWGAKTTMSNTLQMRDSQYRTEEGK